MIRWYLLGGALFLWLSGTSWSHNSGRVVAHLDSTSDLPSVLAAALTTKAQGRPPPAGPLSHRKTPHSCLQAGNFSVRACVSFDIRVWHVNRWEKCGCLATGTLPNESITNVLKVLTEASKGPLFYNTANTNILVCTFFFYCMEKHNWAQY